MLVTRRSFVVGSTVTALPWQTRAQEPQRRETRTYKMVGALEVKADIYPGTGTTPRPVILYIHGGALLMESRRGMPPRWELERFTAAGYTVVSIDYRLAPATKLEQIVEDVTDAHGWIRSEANSLNVDPNRIVVMGMSAGAYLALMAGFRLNPRPKAVVSFYGYGNITGDWYTQPSPFYGAKPEAADTGAFSALEAQIVSEPSGDSNGLRNDLYLYARQHGLWPKLVSGHDPLKEPTWFAPYEPIRHITSSYPPTILLHGQRDTDVPFEQAKALEKAFLDNKVPYQLVTDPSWEHAFDYRGSGKDPKLAVALDRVIAFMTFHVH